MSHVRYQNTTDIRAKHGLILQVILQSKLLLGGTNHEISKALTNSMAAPSQSAIDKAQRGLEGMCCLTNNAGRSSLIDPTTGKTGTLEYHRDSIECTDLVL